MNIKNNSIVLHVHFENSPITPPSVNLLFLIDKENNPMASYPYPGGKGIGEKQRDGGKTNDTRHSYQCYKTISLY
jgi:hypothetical protein